MSWRLFKYIIQIQQFHLKQHKSSTLPLVYPIVLYTGKNKYKHSLDIFDLYGEKKTLAKKIMMHPFKLIDLSQTSDEKLLIYKMFGLMASIAKHIHDDDILPHLIPLLKTMANLAKQGEEDYIYTMLSYVVEAGEVNDQKKFIEHVSKAFDETQKGNIMTLAEQWKKEGEARGLKKGILEGEAKGLKKGILEGEAKGMLKGKEEAAKNLLRQGISMDVIQKATGLSLKEIETLKKKGH